MVSIKYIVKLSSEFSDQVEEAANTLRSRQLPFHQKEPVIDVVETEPLSGATARLLEKAEHKLIQARNDINDVIGCLQDFNPKVSVLFYNINRNLLVAEEAYQEASNIDA